MTEAEANQLIAVIRGMVGTTTYKASVENTTVAEDITYCNEHGEPMEVGTSKTKFNKDGSPKHYRFHKVDGKMCFGKGVVS